MAPENKKCRNACNFCPLLQLPSLFYVKDVPRTWFYPAQEIFLASCASLKLDLIAFLIKCFFSWKKVDLQKPKHFGGNVLICNFFHQGDCLAFKKDSILDLKNQK